MVPHYPITDVLLHNPPTDLLQLVKAQEKALLRSKYANNVVINKTNHITSGVFGVMPRSVTVTLRTTHNFQLVSMPMILILPIDQLKDIIKPGLKFLTFHKHRPFLKNTVFPPAPIPRISCPFRIKCLNMVAMDSSNNVHVELLLVSMPNGAQVVV